MTLPDTIEGTRETTVSHDRTDDAVEFTQEFWDDRYRSAEQLWSGQPNAQLVAQAAGLAAGEALDAGCGALDPGAWEILVASGVERPATDLDGQPVTVKDTVLRARRR
jgi:hypothetical protein